MKIAFFSMSGSCDYERVGGAESTVRRLAKGLLRLGHSVDYIIYGKSIAGASVTRDGIGLKYCRNIKDGLKELGDGYDHVITIYIGFWDRIRFFVHQYSKSGTKFHKLMLGTPYSGFRWLMFFMEILFNTRRGTVLTISPKTFEILRRMTVRSFFLWPPVTEEYYLTRCTIQNVLTLAYLGRYDREKGYDKVQDVFHRYEGNGEIMTTIEGYYCENHRGRLVMETDNDGEIMKPDSTLHTATYSQAAERRIIDLLHQVDIVLLPYKSMHGTIDPPLSLLEAMAAGCACITTQAGNVVTAYGLSRFIVDYKNFVEEASNLIDCIKRDPSILQEERRRVRRRVQSLQCDLGSVTGRLLESLICPR
jgi:glycosyltransferase involved in cell wall biosynthesis